MNKPHKLIDSNGENPIVRDTIQDMLINYGYSPKNIFSGAVQLDDLDYQKKPRRDHEDLIRLYYDKILNRPLTQTDYIILTDGTLGAANCICWTLQKLMKKTCFDPLKIYHVNKPPTYYMFKNIDNVIPNCKYINHEKYIPDVGLIISPNNPTGEVINERPGYFQIIDSIYDTPIFTGQSQSVNTTFSDNEIRIESLSKIGAPSYRFGWAITSNPMIYSKAYEYKKIYNLGQNMASYSMAKNYIDLIHKTNIFDAVSKTTFQIFNKRYKEITDIFAKYDIYDFKASINKHKYAPYVFLPISNLQFNSIGIDTRKGDNFFYSNKYSRINLMMNTNDYNKMLILLNNKYI